MSNLEPPRDRLVVWKHQGRVRVHVQIGDNIRSSRTVLATLTEDQARDLLHDLAEVLGESTFRDEDDGE